ncbi:MAG: DUF4296 domain-containing protein [Bacteroidota bacterium]|uniref:DUF4296 domain-containing protein n=1 Tax=Candidatus Pollutiaquabacter sp. TaxID=3416354 RepID=UPI001A525E04|nr:DUF4296 domain-containing protein [Bacteroidota bacterium]MBL7949801.1 DUF4296 domain-containing protein [Bacteroidia bacterium]MBP7269343.1 DUF4296 domain-containing protein [Bacteroidia bacterium]MBP7438090.1 DUF4296 domain-containing protein [Bacteroidia bacterium]MBP7727909.1 DUF4296 domain-containing protein [Bacteroidia bacterium]
MTRFGFWLISITFFFSACSRKETPLPEGILDRKALVPVLVDVHLAQASVAILRTADTTAHAMGDYMDFILRQHGLDTATYARTIRYYGEHPDLLSELYDDVIDELSRIQGEAQQKND